MKAAGLHVGGGRQVGALTLFPIWSEAPEPADDYVVADATCVRFGEEARPSVPQLTAKNSASRPALLVAGRTCPGGLQDRVLNTTVLLKPWSTTTIPVSCVEAGRWGRGARHERPTIAPARLRASQTSAVNRSRRRGEWAADQSDVWRNVERYRAGLGADAPTGSLHDVRDHVVRSRGSMRERIGSPFPGQRGVAVGVGGRVVSLEVFDRAETLAATWAMLAESWLSELSGAPSRPTRAQAARDLAAQIHAMRFAMTPSVDLGEDLRGESRGAVVAALGWKGRLVHLTAFAKEPV